MGNNEQQDKIFANDLGASEEEVYNALLELGWILPQNEEELSRAERGLEGYECPPFPPELEDPAPIIERLRREQKAKSDADEKQNKRGQLQLVKNNANEIKQREFALANDQQAQLFETDEDLLNFAALLHSQAKGQTPSAVAAKLGVTTIFLKLVDDNKKFVPKGWIDELAGRAKNVYSIDEARSRRSFEQANYQPIAASRSTPYSNRKATWQEILEKSRLPPEAQQFWRLLAEKGEQQ